MGTVHDVAARILDRAGPMSTMKLQKLVYYSQAWHLAWEGVPLFGEPIEAWANGPVVYELFTRHRGRFQVAPPWVHGSAAELTNAERNTVDLVVEDYGRLSGRELSLLAHSERPWREAREGLGPTDRSREEISQESLAEFYAALDASDEATPVVEVVFTDTTD